MSIMPSKTEGKVRQIEEVMKSVSTANEMHTKKKHHIKGKYHIFSNISQEFLGDFTKLKQGIRLIYGYAYLRKKLHHK